MIIGQCTDMIDEREAVLYEHSYCMLSLRKKKKKKKYESIVGSLTDSIEKCVVFYVGLHCTEIYSLQRSEKPAVSGWVATK